MRLRRTTISTRQRGMALMLVLLILFVLTVLTGAFVQVNSVNLNLLTRSINRSYAEAACSTAVHYAWQRLDQNQSWGDAAYYASAAADEAWPTTAGANARLQTHWDGAKVTGFVKDSDCRFEIRVYNNLANDTVDTVNNVPKRAVRLSIDGYSRTSKRHAEVVLRKKAFVDASAVSEDQLSVTQVNSKWRISSTDPILNLIRSNDMIVAPDLLGGTTKMEFMQYGTGASSGPFGAAWAQHDIWSVFGSVNLGTDLTQRAVAANRVKGEIVPNSGSEYQIPDLQASDLNTPENEVPLLGGTYTFKIAGTNNPTIPGTAGTAAVTDPLTGAVITPAVAATAAVPGFVQWDQSLEYRAPGVPITDPPTRTLMTVSMQGPEGDLDNPVPLDHDVWVPIAGTDQTNPAVQANLRTGQIAVVPDTKAVVSSGDFIVNGQEGAGSLSLGTNVPGMLSTTPPPPPTTSRGRRGRHGWNHYGGHGSSNPLPPEISGPSAIEVQNGSIDVLGAATGLGALLAKTDVRMRLKNAMSTDPDVGIAIYAGQDVKMDWLATQFGTTVTGSKLTGLIYAGRNFAINDAYGQDVSVEGAVVAKSGYIQINNANHVDLKYNPDYLYDILDSSTSTATRLEQISFVMR